MNTLFGDMAANLATFNPELEAINAARPHAEKIVELNRDDQMFEQGIKSDGSVIGRGDYHPVTKEKKAAEGQRYDHITLRDTQKFHASMKVKFNDKSFKITADDKKTNDLTGAPEYLTDIYGDEILGLTDENLDFVKEKFILPTLQQTFRHKLFANKNTF
jgi:hypothetical protein